MITILIVPLALGEPPMFRRTFTRPADADDYVAFWTRLGNAHIRRQ